MRRVLLATLLAACALGAAARGHHELWIELPASVDPIAPLAGVASVPGTMHVHCVDGPVPLAVELSVADVPRGYNISISPQTVYADPFRCPDGSVDLEFKVLVSTTHEARAFTPTPLHVRANATGPNGTLEASQAVVVEAGYASVLDLDAQTTMATARPQTVVTFPLDLANFGNGPTRVRFEVVSKPDGWQVVAPLPVVVAAAFDPGNASVVPLSVLTPHFNGYLNEVAAITVRATSAHALRPEAKGDSTQVSVLVTVKGWYVPDGGAPAAFATLAAAAVLASLRRPR